MVLESIRQAFIAYRLKNITAFLMLQEFENYLGILKAFKYYWAFSTSCSAGEAIELNKVLTKSIKKMSFRDPQSVLASTTVYKDALYKVSQILYDYLLSNQERIQPTTEVRINATISSLHGYSLAHLLQARPLPHLVSTTSLHALRPLLFSSGDNLQKALRSAEIDDLIIILLMFLVALAKCTDTSNSAPGFRGLEWLRDKARDFDLSWLPMTKKDRIPATDSKSGSLFSEEFPAIVPEKSAGNQVNLQELMAAEALENKKKMAELEKQRGTKWNQFTPSNMAAQGLSGNSFQQLPMSLPFGPGFKIPLMDTSKPAPKQLVANTLPVNPFAPLSTTAQSPVQAQTFQPQPAFQPGPSAVYNDGDRFDDPVPYDRPPPTGNPIFKNKKNKISTA